LHTRRETLKNRSKIALLHPGGKKIKKKDIMTPRIEGKWKKTPTLHLQKRDLAAFREGKKPLSEIEGKRVGRRKQAEIIKRGENANTYDTKKEKGPPLSENRREENEGLLY